MPEITFLSDIAQHCTITLSDPSLIVAWAQTLAGKITPAQYLDLYKHLVTDPKDIANATEIVNTCMGPGA